MLSDAASAPLPRPSPPLALLVTSVGIVDVTLTAGQVALWSGTVTNEMLLPVLPRLDRAGLAAVELIDPDVFEACVTGLGEDPWERIRLAAKRLTRTPAAAWIAGRYLFGRSPMSVDVLRRGIRCLARNGISRLGCYDPLNDVAQLRGVVQEAKDARLSVCGGIVFAIGEAYDDEYFAGRARKLAALGCDAICLLDFSGILHPERARDLVPQLHLAGGGIPLELRTHCRSARAEITCFAALELGVKTLHAVSEPASGGDSLPSTDFFIEHLAREGYHSALDRHVIDAIRDYFEGVADYWQLPKAVTRLYDACVDRHQVPPGLESRFQVAFSAYGRTEFLEEVAAVRKKSGSPPMAVATAVMLCEQAERNFHAGTPGKVTGIDLAAAEATESMEDDNAELVMSDEERVTAAHFPTATLRNFRAARTKVDRSGWEVVADTPLQQLMGELNRRPWITEICVSKGSFVLKIGTGQ